MLRSICFVGALLATTAPALAQSCGTAPLGPAIPTSSEITGKTTDDAHNVVLVALKAVKSYQASLSSFRECLVTQTGNQKALVEDAQSRGEKQKATDAQEKMQALQKAYDRTVDTETQVVADYTSLHDAYCGMGTGLAGCAKPK